MTTRELFLSKNYTVVESPIDFKLKFNSKSWDAGSADDTIRFKSGWYIFDNNSLLAPFWNGYRNRPKYNAWIEYDETLLVEGAEVVTYTCYVNPKAIDRLDTDITEISAPQMGEVLSSIDNQVSAVRQGFADFGDYFVIPQISNIGALDCVELNFNCVGSGYFSFGESDLSFENCYFYINGTVNSFVAVYAGGGRCAINGVEKTYFELSSSTDCHGFFRGHIVHTDGERGVSEFVEWLRHTSVTI